MLPVRFHPDPDPTSRPPAEPADPSPIPGGRLNLLLSYAGWQPDSWADRLPRLLEPMGVRSHRAATAREATRVIETIPIHVAIVDLGLPLDDRCQASDEAGPRLLELLARTSTHPPTVIIKRQRTARDDRRELAAGRNRQHHAIADFESRVLA